jgi:two-component system cell cycle sensor histidine kinase/response regulator CckA
MASDEPTSEATATAHTPADPPAGILVVDDDAAVRSGLERVLRRRGFAVWAAAGGAEAVDLYREHAERIGVVLTDVRMPGVNGADTVAALRRLDPAVRVCFMTCEPEDIPDTRVECVFPKPFTDVSDLADELRRIASDRPRRSFPPTRL